MHDVGNDSGCTRLECAMHGARHRTIGRSKVHENTPRQSPSANHFSLYIHSYKADIYYEIGILHTTTRGHEYCAWSDEDSEGGDRRRHRWR